MSKEIVLKCDLCHKKDAHELPCWFEITTGLKSVKGFEETNTGQIYITGINSNGWARYAREFYLCSKHHEALDKLIANFLIKAYAEAHP